MIVAAHARLTGDATRGGPQARPVPFDLADHWKMSRRLEASASSADATGAFRAGRRSGGDDLRLALLQIADGELELLDLAIEDLRGAAVARPFGVASCAFSFSRCSVLA